MRKHFTYSRCLILAALASGLAIPLGSRLSTVCPHGRNLAFPGTKQCFGALRSLYKYKVQGRTYSVENRVWDGQYGDWSPNDTGNTFAVYVNRGFPFWWRWQPLRVPFSQTAMGGFVVLFILLWLKQKSTAQSAKSDCTTNDESDSES
jgi:hypothetical protein